MTTYIDSFRKCTFWIIFFFLFLFCRLTNISSLLHFVKSFFPLVWLFHPSDLLLQYIDSVSIIPRVYSISIHMSFHCQLYPHVIFAEIDESLDAIKVTNISFQECALFCHNNVTHSIVLEAWSECNSNKNFPQKSYKKSHDSLYKFIRISKNWPHGNHLCVRTKGFVNFLITFFLNNMVQWSEQLL